MSVDDRFWRWVALRLERARRELAEERDPYVWVGDCGAPLSVWERTGLRSSAVLASIRSAAAGGPSRLKDGRLVRRGERLPR